MVTANAQVERWIDRQVIDRSGHRLGAVADVYVDDGTGVAEWLAVTTGLFGTRVSFVPLEGAHEGARGTVQVAYEKSLVKDSPNIELDGDLSLEEEARLYRHYGFAYQPYGAPHVVVIDDTASSAADEEIDLTRTGSASVGREVTPEIARTRLRRRDAAAVGALDLRPDDIDEGTSRDGRTVGRR